MKIMFPVENNSGMDSKLDKRFGRAAFFLCYDTGKKEVVSVEANEFKSEGHGVGIKSATLAVDKGCRAVIGARPGPKAASVLVEAKINVMVVEDTTANDALEIFLRESA